MKKFLNTKIIAGCILTAPLCTSAQVPTIEWQKSLGGSEVDIANSIRQTNDGGYVVAGYTRSSNGDVSGNHGDWDYWIVKLGSTGVIQWQKALGGTDDDEAKWIQQTNDGGYIVAGLSSSNNGDITGHHGTNATIDCWVVKLNSIGSIQWQKSLGGTWHDEANSIQQTTDGGYILAGRTGSNDGDITGYHGGNDFWIVKLSSTGNIQWQKSLGGTGADEANSIQQTTDGGYIVAGVSTVNDGDVSGNHGVFDYWVVKLSSSGNIQWQKSLGGTSWDEAKSIRQTSDGGYVVTGFSSSSNGDITNPHGGYDYWVVRLNSTGGILWQKSLGGTGWDEACSIQQTTDDGYFVTGFSESTDGDVIGKHSGSFSSDFWIVKLSNTGGIQWQKCLGGTSKDKAHSGWQTIDGGYIIAGESYSTDGDVSGNHGNNQIEDYWVVKLYASGSTNINENMEERVIKVYPNPTNEKLVVFSDVVSSGTVEVYTITGSKLLSINAPALGNTEINLPSKGVFLVKIIVANSVYTQRIIVN